MLSRNRIKYIQSLSHKKLRDEYQCFIAETPKVVNEFLNSSYKAEIIYAEKKWLDLAGHEFSSDTEVVEVSPDDLERITLLKNAHSVVAVMKIPAHDFSGNIDGKVMLALDDLQDPGNMGTIIRIADWFGIEDVICSRNTVSSYNPKVVQATMGSLAHVRVHYLSLEEFIGNTKLPVFATALDGKSIYKTEPVAEGVIVIGNEGKGINETIMSLVKNKISIPRIGHAESLNAAVATGIILSHILNTKQ